MSDINLGNLQAEDDVQIGKINIPLITPKRGIDYWTPSDKQEVITEAVNEINAVITPQEQARQNNESTRQTNEAKRIENEIAREERFTEIETLVGNLEDDVEEMQEDITDIQVEQNIQNTNIQNNTTAISNLTTRVSNNEDNIETLQGQVSTLQTDLDTAEGNITNMQNDIENIQDEQEVQNDYIADLQEENTNLKKALLHIEGEGTDITLNNTSYNKMELQIKGNTEQEQLTGKNLVDIPDITLNSTGYIYNGNIDLKAGTYTLSMGQSSQASFSIAIIGENGTLVSRSITLPYTFTINEKATSMRLYSPGAGTFKNIMIEQNSTATSYEPYCGGIPSPNPDYPQQIKNVRGNANVKIQNKNLFDSSNLINWYVNYSEPVGYSSNIYCGINQFFKLKPNTSYTISTKQNVKRLFMPLYDKDYNILRQTVIIDGKQVTFTTNSIEQYAKVCFSLDGTTTMEPNNYKEFIQIEFGSTATSYVPHQEQNYPFSLKSKNLVDISTLEKGYVSATGIITVNDTMGERYSKFIKVKPDTNYIFSIIETSSTYDNWFGVGEYSSNNYSSFIRRDTKSVASQGYIQFTTSSTTEYIVVSARNLKDATKIQLEQGTTATDYEPYYDIKAMEGTTLQDDGIHQMREQRRILSNPIYISDGVFFVYIGCDDYSTALCSHFTNARNSQITDNGKAVSLLQDGEFNFRVGTSDRVYFKNSNITSQAECNSFLSNNEIYVEYTFKGNEEIIPYNETQQAQYNAIKQAKSYDEQTNISSTSDEIGAVVKVSAIGDLNSILTTMQSKIDLLEG